MRADLNKERRDNFDKMWERYHNGGIPDLPSQVYLDIGYLMGWLTDADRNVWPDDLPSQALLDGQAHEIELQKRYVRWMAQTIHQGYHTDDPGAWNGDCPKDVCSSTRRHLQEYGKKIL
jgi:hypothetical protein